jgi:hypothetical protein
MMTSSTSSSLKKTLPMELRVLVYMNGLQLQPGLQAPALLLALAANQDLYAEALPIYEKINFFAKIRNKQLFLKMPLKDLLKIRHLTLVWEGNDLTPDRGWLSLTANRAYLQNNLETITIDLTGENCSTTFIWTESTIKYLIIAA